MSNSPESGFPRSARIALWLIGGLGALLVIAVIVVNTMLGNAASQAPVKAAEIARGFAADAVGDLRAASRGGTLTDDQIAAAVTKENGRVKSVKRTDSAIDVTARIEAMSPGVGGEITADLCFTYTIALPVQPASKIDMRELPSCPE